MHEAVKHKSLGLRVLLITLAVLLLAGATLFAALYKPHAAAPSAESLIDGQSHDFGDINMLPRDFSAGTVSYLGSMTSMEAVSVPDSAGTTGKTSTMGRWTLHPGETGVFKIYNCAYDNNFDLCDVEITVDEVTAFSAGTGHTISLTAYLHSGSNTYYPLIDFAFNTSDAHARLQMRYLKAGTDTPADITYTCSMFSDIDVRGSTSVTKDEVFEGMESVYVPQSRSSMYYLDSDDGDLEPVVGPDKNVPSGLMGVYNETGEHFTGETTTKIKETSMVVLQRLENNRFTCYYSGTSAGITWAYVSPYTYDTPGPSKSVSKTLVHEEEEFEYTISQLVPNNYFGNTLNFLDDGDTQYTKFVLKDSVPKGLTVTGTPKILTDNATEDASKWFTVTHSGNDYTFTATADALTDKEFYNEVLTIKIPVKVAAGDGKTATLPFTNSATLEYTNSVETDTLTSNEVKTDMEFNLQIEFGIDEEWAGAGTPGVQTKPRLDSTPCGGEMPDGSYMYWESRTLTPGASVDTTLRFRIDEGYRVDHVELNGRTVPLSDLSYDPATDTYSYRIQNSDVREDIKESLYVYTEPCFADLLIYKTVGTGSIGASGIGYSPAGAVYGVYRDNGCEDRITTLTINADGHSDTLRLSWEDTDDDSMVVYVKEISTPPAADGVVWSIDPTSYRVELRNDNPPSRDAAVPVFTVNSTDDVQEYGYLRIRKTTMPGAVAITTGNSLYSLAGAEFRVEARDGGFTTTLTTGADGWTDAVRLETGWYTVTETKAPKGYMLPDTVSYDIFVGLENTEATPTTQTFEDNPYASTLPIEIDKQWGKY